MRIRNLALALTAAVMLAVSLPLAAETPRLEITGRAVWLHPTTGDRTFSFDDEFFSEFNSKYGYGLGINLYLVGPLSLEVGASVIRPDYTVRLFETDGPSATMSVRTIPITAGLQYHFWPGGMIDVYLGGGGTYVRFERIEGAGDLALNDVGAIDIDNHKIGLMGNAGASIAVTNHLAFNVDGKYLAVRPRARVTFVRGDVTAERRVRFDALLVSAGVAWRF